MISLSLIKKEEYKEAKSILEFENIEDCFEEGIVYILKDRDEMLGLGKISLEKDYGILKYIVVRDEYRGANLGDALLRVLIYKAESLGIDRVYFRDGDSYLLSNGFLYNGDNLKDTYRLILNVHDFFNKSCSNCGGKNGF